MCVWTRRHAMQISQALATSPSRGQTLSMAIETQYARASDGTYVAYQVTGSGPVDMLIMRGWITNIEHEWADPTVARMYKRLAAGGRLIRLDRRGMGLSDRIRPGALPTIESRVDDIVSVLDAVGSRRVVPIGLGQSSGSTLAAMFAAIHPDRVAGLVLYQPSARGAWASDYPWGMTVDQLRISADTYLASWGTPELGEQWARNGAPSRAGDPGLVAWLADHQRLSGTPEDAVALLHIDYETDIRAALGSIHLPALVVSRAGARPDLSRYVAGLLPDARYVELPGEDNMAISGDTDAVLREIVAFVESLPDSDDASDAQRVLATVLFVDIVDSTSRAVALGDRRWAELLAAERACLRELVAGFRGREVDATGDGYLAAFDGPGRAIRCARAAVDAVRDLGLEIRVGVHTGECERVGDQLQGVAVHIGARVAALAGPSEVLASGTVKDLVAGSGITFAFRGQHRLKGVPGDWPIYAVVP